MHTGLKTKELIEKTALALFVEKGITETTIRDIASSAKIAEGTMYRHFASKEQLAWEIFSKHFTAFALELEQVQKEQGNVKKKIEAMVRDICAFFDNDPVLFSYLFLFALHGQIRKVTPDMPHPLVVLQDVIEEGMKRGEIPKKDPNVVAAMVAGILLQTATSIVYGRIQQSFASLADELFAVTWKLVKG